jgi:single-strand DNA-binding protein
MAANLNKAMIIGNLGVDPEVRYTQSGTPVCNLRIATHERWTTQDGEAGERTEWHNVTVFGKTAENCGKYLTKGRAVYVEGRLQTRKWEDKDGQDRYTTEIVANTVQFLSGGSGEASEASNSPRSSKAGYDPDFDNDDIPF